MIGLAPLLTALREAGLPVGVMEMARLQRVFALAPEPGGDRLRGLLRTILVKSAEDRAIFERVFATWLAQVEYEVRLTEAPRDRDKASLPAQSRRLRPVQVLRRRAAAVLLLAFSLSLDGHFASRPRRTAPVGSPSSVPIVPTRPSAPQTDVPILETIYRITFGTSVPGLTVELGPWPDWLPLGLSAVALFTAAALWQASSRRRWDPEPMPAPSRKGPPRVFLSPAATVGLQLLQPREEEALVWGIGSFVAEEPTRRLHLPATVLSTARAAGIPQLVFHEARYPREVWLWLDEAADDPAIPLLAEEVAAALEVHGLLVEQAIFTGAPDWLVHPDGQVFSPNEVDERRDAALVAILTDGRVLARQYAADDRRVGLDALLRGLSHWPHLTFVDFSPTAGELGKILAPHGLEWLVPEKLAGFLGAYETLHRRAEVAEDDVAVWAAACALAPSPVDETRAFELRRRLGLKASPWLLRALRAEAPGPPGRLHWTAPDRTRRINWLHAAEAQAEDEGGLAPDSLLGRALGFWEEVYDRELADRTAGETGTLWQETPAHQHLLMERALLALWNAGSVGEAVRALYSLHGGALHDTIEEHLSCLAPLDWGDPNDLHLPWRWETRTAIEQDMLLAMNLRGGMPPVTLRRSGRLWLGLALCLGLAAGALATSLGGWRDACRNGETFEDQSMVFVRVCPGTFRMGSSDEGPAHEVMLSEYWIGQYEVTEEQYGKKRGSQLPATNVTWFDAKKFCEERGWRLPTEAEWECAAQAGTPTAWSFGDDEKDLDEYAWFGEGFEGEPHPVGTKKPNPWSIHDMHGNVWEWVADRYGPYQASSQRDRERPDVGSYRVLRGGAFFNSPRDLRSAYRNRLLPSDRGRNVGFRCAYSPRRQAFTLWATP